MAGATVKILKNHCTRVAGAFPRESGVIVRTQVLESESHVKINIQKYDAIDTGFMLNSTAGEMTGEFSGAVSVHAEYAHYVNDGTVHMSGRPFFSDEVHRAETAFPEKFRALEGRLA